MDWEKIGETVVAVAVGGGLTATGAWLLNILKQRQEFKEKDREANRQDRRDALQELSDILAARSQDLAKLEAKVERALENERECEKKWTRALAYIEYISYEAQRQGWPVRPFQEHGTDVHPILPPDVPEDRRVADDPTRKGPERRRPQRRGGGEVELHGPTPDPPTGDNGG